MKFAIKPSTKKKWRNAGILLCFAAVAVGIFWFNASRRSFYDFSYLTVRADFGEARDFTPLSGGSIPGMDLAAQNSTHALYVNRNDATITVLDMRNGFEWSSRPADMLNDPIANSFERNVMHSHLGIRYYDSINRLLTRWSYDDAVSDGQVEFFSIPDGVRIVYTVGDQSLGIHALPPFMYMERFEALILSNLEDIEDIRFMDRWWIESRDAPGVMQLMTGGLQGSVINANRMLALFEQVGYTLEDLAYDNAAHGVEVNLELDFFEITINFVLDGASLVVNIPMHQLTSAEGNLLERLELMRFFGAGGADEEGFILVPGGSGGLISFNNGRLREEAFFSQVYGRDEIMNRMRSQIIQPVRMPVLGIAREGAAMLAQIEQGSALAFIHADIAGRTNSFNYAWFSFSLRSSAEVNMEILEGGGSSMRIVQPHAYDGDITVRYHFLAGDDANLGGMAAVYQQSLIDRGVLTPLPAANDTSFYLDIIGAVDVRQHFFGTPYMTTRVMTTVEDMHRFLDLLEENGIHRVQMQLHGWFNRGINHDVAKNINPIRGVGSGSELASLDARLRHAGGGLFPAVNFQFTNWNSRNFNAGFESARDPAGHAGVVSRVARDLLTTDISWYGNDFFSLVTPAVLPFHIDEFLTAFNRRTDFNALALTDLGDVLVESMYRRNGVDREHSRLIVAEQLNRLSGQIPNIMVEGGNDFSLRYANHLVGVPTHGDYFYMIDYMVPFYQMVVHGFIEYAGHPVNIMENSDTRAALLNSLATGAAPRYIWTAEPTRALAFSPHERFYSTHYINWMDEAIRHYRIFNDVYRYLRTDRIIDFEVLAGSGEMGIAGGAGQITVTVFSDGTRIYVNNTRLAFEHDGLIIEPQWFYVKGGA